MISTVFKDKKPKEMTYLCKAQDVEKLLERDERKIGVYFIHSSTMENQNRDPDGNEYEEYTMAKIIRKEPILRVRNDKKSNDAGEMSLNIIFYTMKKELVQSARTILLEQDWGPFKKAISEDGHTAIRFLKQENKIKLSMIDGNKY